MTGSPALLLCLAFLQLVHRGLAGDSVDVNVLLYSDPNCFDRSDKMVLLDRGCYANRYANETKAFELTIVVFEGDPKVDLREFVNDCQAENLYSPSRTLKAGRCERFVGGFYAIIALRLRSNACEGASCSPISVARQSFFTLHSCQGVASQVYEYPLQGECLRWWNGTRLFRTDDYGNNISQVDYPGSDGCNGGQTERYETLSGMCFPLDSTDPTSPKSFLWEVDPGKNILPSAGAFRGPASLGAASFALLATMVT